MLQLNSQLILELSLTRWRFRSPLCHDAAMRTRMHAVAFPSEIGDFAEEVRRVFIEFGRAFSAESLTGECSPPVDVYETDDAVEIAVDLPGVNRDAVRIMCKGDTILVVGEKAPRLAGPDSSFHLVERGYGRFARVVRLNRACDTANARARLVDGELHVSVSKIGDRRGKTIIIALDASH